MKIRTVLELLAQIAVYVIVMAEAVRRGVLTTPGLIAVICIGVVGYGYRIYNMLKGIRRDKHNS